MYLAFGVEFFLWLLIYKIFNECFLYSNSQMENGMGFIQHKTMNDTQFPKGTHSLYEWLIQ